MKIYPKIPSRRVNRWVAKKRKNKLLVRAVTGLFILFLLFTAATIGTFAWFSKDLPSPYKLTNREIAQSTQIYDRNGVLLYSIHGDENRTLVQLKDIPQYLKEATISTEDRNFYTNQGFDPLGMARAVKDLVIYHQIEGGSTLTQQLVKNALLSNEQTITRKIKELILSVQIDKRYSKDEILQIYLNEIPYGGTAFGAEAASQQYFGKSVKDLNLLESAVLAGLPQEPSYYSPFGVHPDAYKDRTKYVLQRMQEDGYITKQQHDEAVKQLASYTVPGSPQGLLRAPHFVLYVKELLERKYGAQTVAEGGLKVTTSLDASLQDSVQKIVTDQVNSEGPRFRYDNGDAMVMDPKTGQILAMVGSKDYFAKNFDGQFNVTLALRNPGSSIKPFNYATGLKKGYTAATLFLDQPTDFPCSGCPGGKYSPHNADGNTGHGHNGYILMRDALAQSLNIPAVKMLAMNGLPAMIQTASDMGITTFDDPSKYGLSLTLGGAGVKMIDMVTAYSAFANTGLRVNATPILKVEDSHGAVLEDNTHPQPGPRVLDPGIAFIMSDILSDWQAKIPTFTQFGAQTLSLPGHRVASKTGTTDDIRDNWTIGYTPSFVVATWVGNNDYSPLSSAYASGITGAAPMWHKIFLAALNENHTKDEWYPTPSNVVQSTIDAIYGTKPVDGDPTRLELFLKSTVPGNTATVKTLRLCKDQKKLATPADEAAGQAYDQTFVYTGDQFTTGAWQPFDPPTDKCNAYRGTNNTILVQLTSPTDGSTQPSTVSLSANVFGPYPVSTVRFFDGSNPLGASSSTGNPYTLSATLPSGPHAITAVATDSNGGTGTSPVANITVSP